MQYVMNNNLEKLKWCIEDLGALCNPKIFDLWLPMASTEMLNYVHELWNGSGAMINILAKRYDPDLITWAHEKEYQWSEDLYESVLTIFCPVQHFFIYTRVCQLDVSPWFHTSQNKYSPELLNFLKFLKSAGAPMHPQVGAPHGSEKKNFCIAAEIRDHEILEYLLAEGCPKSDRALRVSKTLKVAKWLHRNKFLWSQVLGVWRPRWSWIKWANEVGCPYGEGARQDLIHNAPNFSEWAKLLPRGFSGLNY
jgi:hypothetical protein